MPNAEQFDALTEREFETLEIMLSARAMRSAITIEEYIQVALAQGASKETIRAYLLNDLETGGRIFGEFRNAIRATGKGSLNRFSDAAQFSEMETGEKQFRWVAVLANTCPDCESRHAKVMTWEAWENEGLPRTGHTVCKEHCRCVLLPADSVEIEVIKRPRKK